MDDIIELRAQCPHFRVLIIGRANAGKTTILKKVCNTTDEPRIYDPHGKQIDMSKVEPSKMRGHHDIDNQMIFSSNPRYIFHDSRGFEAGGADELGIVKSFIEKRASMTRLRDQLHAIWYCIPTDNSRPLLAADEVFFKECGTGKVPVIAIFTKFDALVTAAFNTLCEDDNKSMKEIRREAPEVAIGNLKANYINALLETKYKPKRHLHLEDMQNEHADCSTLIKETATAIDDDALQLLFVSVQQNNLALSTDYAVSKGFLKHAMTGEKLVADPLTLIRHILVWFPHIWHESHNYSWSWEYEQLELADSGVVPKATAQASLDKFSKILPEVDKVSDGSSVVNFQMCSLVVATIICARHSFSLPSTIKVLERFQQSMDLYQTSHAFESVHKALQQVFLEPDLINGLTSPNLCDVQVFLADILLSIIQDHSLASAV